MEESKRSKVMRAVKKRDTGPEIQVRKAAHRLGYRFRLHRKDLPGTPDLVLPRHGIALFVHGCFWHQHPDPACPLANRPQSNLDYWEPKLRRNQERDARAQAELEQQGWSVVVIWECQVERENLPELLARSLGEASIARARG